jgi:hypothetical protein
VPLEGLVETDWSVATFTMNWKLTTPGLEVRFERDDPICMLVPQRRGELESFEPSVGHLQEQPELQRHYQEWEQARNDAIARLDDPGRPVGLPTEWQRDYLRGTSPGGSRASEHQTRLQLREFVHRDGAPAPER